MGQFSEFCLRQQLFNREFYNSLPAWFADFWRNTFLYMPFLSCFLVRFFPRDQKVKTEIWISLEQKEIQRWNKSKFLHQFSRAFSCQKLSQTCDCALNTLAIIRGLLCNFTKNLKSSHFMWKWHRFQIFNYNLLYLFRTSINKIFFQILPYIRRPRFYYHKVWHTSIL